MSGNMAHLAQRRNGEIIIQTLMSLENSTFKNIVAKICDDNNIIDIWEREEVTAIVKHFLRKSYYYGYLQLNFNGAFKLNEIIVSEQQRQKHPAKQLRLHNVKQRPSIGDNKVMKRTLTQRKKKSIQK